MALTEQIDDFQECRRCPLTEERDPQCSGDSTTGVGGPSERVLHPCDERHQVIGQLTPDRRESNGSTGPLEQHAADPPLKFLDHLADPPGRHAEALCGTAEMQLLGKRQKGLDLHPFQHDAPIVESD